MDARFSLVSAILSDLKDNGIVLCLNEEDKTGRLYVLRVGISYCGMY